MAMSSDPVLEALWKRALDQWDDEARHHAFLDYCRTRQCLAEAAARYRGMSADRTRHEQADRKLKAVALLAMTMLETERSLPREPSAGRPALALLVVSFFVLATLGLMAYLRATR